MPLKFWNDKNDIKFKKAYFNNFLNTWYHGDYAEIKKGVVALLFMADQIRHLTLEE